MQSPDIEEEQSKTIEHRKLAQSYISDQKIDIQNLSIVQSIDILMYVLSHFSETKFKQIRTINFLQRIIDDLSIELHQNSGKLFVKSLYSQFMKFIHREKIEITSQNMILLTQYLASYKADRIEAAVKKVAILFNDYVKNGSTICIFGLSNLVIRVLLHIKDQFKKVFTIIFATSTLRLASDLVPSYLNQLIEKNIEVQLIPEGAVFLYQDKIDFFVVGAEAVTKDGGIINQTGTASMALIASYSHKPFYVLSEFCKFSEIFVMTQQDLDLQLKEPRDVTMRELQQFLPKGEKICYSDFTAPQHIQLIFTEIGVFTPLEAADELVLSYMTTTFEKE